MDYDSPSVLTEIAASGLSEALPSRPTAAGAKPRPKKAARKSVGVKPPYPQLARRSARKTCLVYSSDSQVPLETSEESASSSEGNSVNPVLLFA